jgi:acetaldehyde dehydrogenase/alcohol dehydrogenase
MALDIKGIITRAQRAADEFRLLNQVQTDNIVEAAYRAGFDKRVTLAKQAYEETGLGIWWDKVKKNVVATRFVFEDIIKLKTVGVINDDKENGIVEIAQPIGPIFAITPITNPTSTVLFKILICLKSRNPLIIRPHGSARKCSINAAKICYEAALAAGAPKDCIQWISRSTRDETLAMMGHKKIALILATGSVELVRAAYRSGNPTLGVGPGNVPAYIGRSANVPFAVEQIYMSKIFDNGTVCASEQAVVVRSDHVEQVKAEFKKRKSHFLSPEEIEKLEKVAFNKTHKVMNVEVIGQPATKIAKMAGIDVPPDTTLLIAELDEVGPHVPLSLEILAPILAFYTATDFNEGIELCRRINVNGGLGHTATIFSQNERKIEHFAQVMNAGRILVNTPASQGAVGGTFNSLQPSFTLACGPGGKNITTDNITAKHLINTQRIARRNVHHCVEDFAEDFYFDEAFDSHAAEAWCEHHHPL